MDSSSHRTTLGKVIKHPSSPPRETIAAVIVTLNEADHIAQCIESVLFCDEIIVVDSFSTDRTVEIATERGAHVVQRQWTTFGDQKQFAIEQIQSDWALVIDADERVTPELQRSILRMLESESSVSGYSVNRVVYHLGQWWQKGGWYPEWRLRIVRRGEAYYEDRVIHERLVVTGRTERIQGELLHYSFDNLADQISRIQRYSALSAQKAFSDGERFSIWSLIWNPFVRMAKFYLLRAAYREGVPGIIVTFCEGFYVFLKYAKLWELEHCKAVGDRSHEALSSFERGNVPGANLEERKGADQGRRSQ